MDETIAELRALLVSELELTRERADQLDVDAPLFGDGGLGLDSLDALQLAVGVEERFGVAIPDGPAARPIFASVRALAAHIVEHR